MEKFSIKKISVLLFLLATVSGVYSQRAVGTWKTYMAYQNAKLVAEAPKNIYAVYDSSLVAYSPDDELVKFYTKADGLSDVLIQQMAYHEGTGTLVLTYDNSNIDLFTNSGIYNIAFLKDNLYYLNKGIHNIEFYNSEAYLSTDFGIVVLDLVRKEVKTTYPLDRVTQSVCIWGDYIYAATNKGVYRALTSSNLQDKNNWILYPLVYDGSHTDNIYKLLVFKDNLCFYEAGHGVYRQDKSQNISSIRLGGFNQVTLLHDQLVLLGESNTYFYPDFNTSSTLSGLGGRGISSIKNNNAYWLSQGNNGLSSIKTASDFSSYTVTMSGLKIDSPKRNWDSKMTYTNNKLLIVGGGWDSNQLYRAGTLMVYEDGKWTNFDEDAIAAQTGLRCLDFTSVAVDPRDPNHYFVSSWGEGVYEFKDNKFIKLYNRYNSTLRSIFPGSTTEDNYVRVDGLAYDKSNNLYMLNTGVTTPMNILTAEGEWKTQYYDKLSEKDGLKKVLITSKNQKWVNLQRINVGLFVVDDKSTIGNTVDDKYAFTNTFIADNREVTPGGIYSLAEDLNGAIWVGTDNGPLVYSSPVRITDGSGQDIRNCTRPKISYNTGDDQAYYTLEGQTLTAIAVDGGNRKWIGTRGAGIFLLNPQGDEVLETFTADNSLLLSNTINDIVLNNETGEVFIATDKGLISYMGDAITGKPDYSNVYAYPNPVKPDFDNDVVVTGLMAESTVKITDLNGNIMKQGPSNGGQFTWNCRNQSGNRVASGVYIVLSSTQNASESVATKIVVIN